MNAEPAAELERLSATVIGRVQGVGFRWWVRSAANRLGVTGWVMNGPDERSVELVAEGSPHALTELDRLLRQGPPGAVVERVDARRSPASGSYGRFQITHP
ncbi:MAG: acylphosphatase [Chloroflexota bacterium]